MSSHHFVKEQQEPALLLLDVAGVDAEAMGALLEWAPTVLVAEAVLEKVLSWGVKIDVALVSEEFAARETELLRAHYPLKFLQCTPETAYATALHYLKASKHEAVHVFGDFGALRQSVLEFTSQLGVQQLLFQGDQKFTPVQSGQWKKWRTPGRITVIPETELYLELTRPALPDMKLKAEKPVQLVLDHEGNYIFTALEQRVFWVQETWF
ncbi:thiamine pyrophosphokinase [Nitritalea halalkaliphila LW7]|uniref:Thiamine pyrophosphokinase n=1 Tax=Nitritalea halalkaliphila LW7 TaxID=1189621 RepID=I5C791_9BACT|nr:hypothetical protein [Nitritalea halalkaliphila]EIM77693.1 thiamine pyrophosphokinase [Nitritalea halalkaliphila LW7]